MLDESIEIDSKRFVFQYFTKFHEFWRYRGKLSSFELLWPVGLFDRAESEGIGVIVRTPLTFGYLTGKLSGDEQFQGTDHRANWPKRQLKKWAQSSEFFSFLFKSGHRMPAQAALRFCLDYKAVSTVIPGMINAREVFENTMSSDMPSLTAQEMELIMRVYKEKENEFYDRNFQKAGPDGTD